MIFRSVHAPARYILPVVGISAMLVLGAALHAQQGNMTVYRSNPAGILIEPISARETGAHEYVAYVRDVAGEYLFRLEKNGTEIERRERTDNGDGSRTGRRYRDGELVSSSIFENGVIVEERSFRNGSLVERIAYEYTDGELDRVEIYNGEGKLESFVQYERGPDGRVYAVKGMRNEETIRGIFRFSEGRVYQEWYGTDDAGTLLRYDRTGELIDKERWREGDLVRMEHVDQEETGRVRRIDEGELEIREYYDPAGRMVRRTVDREGERVETVINRHENGLLVENRTITPGKSTRLVYEYDANGDRAKLSEYENTRLVKVTEWTGETPSGEETRFEEIYRDGVAALRVYFEGDRKVREEVFK